MSQKQEKRGLCNNYTGGDSYNGLYQPIEKESPLEVLYIPSDGNLDILDRDPNILEGDEALEKSSIAPVSSILGMKIPENAPCIVTKAGIRIYSKDPRKTRILQRIYEAHPRVWEDQGLIDMLESQMMKILFIEGWQYTKFNFRLYLLGYEEQTIFDKKYDVLYKKDRIDYIDEISPIALLVFVV